MTENNEMMIKILILGESSVGKSCLLMRFADNSFSSTFMSTIGIDFKIKKVEIDGQSVRLQLWDTAGQEKFRTITRSYYRGAHGIMVVYDVSNRDSFEKVSAWMNSIFENTTEGYDVVLVGNKKDLDAKVTTEEGRQMAAKHSSDKVDFFEVSALSGEGVKEAFMHLATKCKNRLAASGKQSPQHGVHPPTQDHKPCCKD